MVIRSDKSNNYIITLLFIIVTLLFAVLSYDESLLVGLIVCFIPYILCFRYWITTGRTIIIAREGCTVKFLWWSKLIYWDDLRIKRVSDYTNSCGYRSPYTKGAEFSTSTIHRPKWLKPLDYGLFTNPFNYFFVYFPPDHMSKADTYYPSYYMCDEVEFLRTLGGWGIHLSAG